MAASSKVPAKKKQTPQQRAIERKRAQWREWGFGPSDDFDPDTFDWAKYGEPFDNLSDDEWAVVWKHVLVASGQKPKADEARARELVNDAAYSSGWFAEFGGELHISRADYRRFAARDRSLLKKVKQFRGEIAEFFGDPPDDHKEPYDPWEEYRPLVRVLDHLGARLQRDMTRSENLASVVKDPPNAAKPKLDIWRARLVLAWQTECRLSVENTKQLRGFLLDALRPYMPRAELTDRMAKHFIVRWLAGDVANPGPSLLRRLRDK